MRGKITQLIVAAAMIVGSTAMASPADFVRASGARFMVGDAPFVFAGANVDGLHGELERARIEETLDAVKADGLTVVRVWALGEGPDDAPAWQREHVLFRVGANGFIEPAFVALDHLLAAAKARGLRVLITLCNAWPDFGGVPQYLAWAGLPTTGYAARDRFYTAAAARKLLLAHIERVVSRTSTSSGVRYADDPTIFGWELMNESQVDSDEGVTARLKFVAELAARVHELAPHQLVSAGVSEYRVRGERAAWRAVCALPGIDFCDSHLYPQTSDLVDSANALYDRVDDRVQLAHYVIGKPIVFGEFGFDTRADHDGWLGATRTRWFDRLLRRFSLDRVDGAIAWIYQPWTGRPRDFGIYVDRADTDDVRTSLKKFAAAIPVRTGRNERLGTAHGDALLYPAYQTLRRPGTARIEHDGGALVVHLRPERFDIARWERTGTWDGGALVHAYGSGDGFYAWRFVMPASAAKKVVVRARISSEYPGNNAPPDGSSRVEVTLDGKLVGAMTAPADDGLGAVVELTGSAPRLRAGRHELRFTVAPGSHGLCVYGARTPNASIDLEATDVQVRFEP